MIDNLPEGHIHSRWQRQNSGLQLPPHYHTGLSPWNYYEKTYNIIIVSYNSHHKKL